MKMQIKLFIDFTTDFPPDWSFVNAKDSKQLLLVPVNCFETTTLCMFNYKIKISLLKLF